MDVRRYFLFGVSGCGSGLAFLWVTVEVSDGRRRLATGAGV